MDARIATSGVITVESSDRPFGRLKLLSLALATTALLCLAMLLPATALAVAADEYESDNSYGTAKPITVGGTAQQHTVYPEGDQDWVSFAVTSGRTYRVETAPGTLGDDLNAALNLYDSNGTTQLTWGQGYYYDETSWGNGYGVVEFTATAAKTIYARVSSGSTGAYALSVTVMSDAFEPDDSYGAARPITVNAAPQQHSIYPSDDEDWVTFSVNAGWKYTILTAQGVPVDADTDLGLALYESDGTTEIAFETSDDYPSIEYMAKANKRVYVRVWQWFGSSGTYALRVTAVPVAVVSAPGNVDFGSVVVGGSQRRTIAVRNTGTAPLTVSSAQITGSGFSIVRNEAVDSPIPAGGSREIEVKYAPTVGYAGSPSAVKHDWTNQLVQYNYSGGSLISYWLFTGFQNVGGPGNLAWRLTCGVNEKTGSAAVVAGGRYTVRTIVYAGPYSSKGLVELTRPVAASWNFQSRLGGLGAVTYQRVPDGTLSIKSNDTENPTVTVDLLGSATKTLTRASCRVTLTLSGVRKGVLKYRRAFTAKGKVTSASLSATKVKLTLQRKKNRKWVKVKTVSRALSATRTYSWKYKPARKGTYRIRATVAQTATNKAGATKWKTFKVR